MAAQVLRLLTAAIALFFGLFGVEYTPNLNEIGEWIAENWLEIVAVYAIFIWARSRLFHHYPNIIRFYAMNVREVDGRLHICLETIRHADLSSVWPNGVDRWEARFRLFMMARRKCYLRCRNGENEVPVAERSQFIRRFFRPMLNPVIEKGGDARKIQDDPDTPRDTHYGALMPCRGPAGDFARSVDATIDVWGRLASWDGEVVLDPVSTGNVVAEGACESSKLGNLLAERIRLCSNQVLDAASLGCDSVKRPVAVVYLFTRLLQKC